MIVGKVENGLERGFGKHRLKCLLITDPYSLEQVILSWSSWLFTSISEGDLNSGPVD